MSTPGFCGGENGLRLLWDAHRYAQELDCNIWEFAVELPFLEDAGLTINQLRWLVHKGLAEHGREITGADDRSRKFQCGGPLIAHRRSCLVLTPKGVAEVTKMLQVDAQPSVRDDEVLSAGANGAHAKLEVQAFCGNPHWDRERQELRLGDTLVKRFKLPSPNQETVLMAFEEDRWPPRIDDPLPPSPEIDSKKRLHDTIKSLNRHQKHGRIRFMGDGRGMGVRWEPMLERSRGLQATAEASPQRQ
jgi:hypothetical protein